MGRLIGRLVKTESRSFLGALMDADNTCDQQIATQENETMTDDARDPAASLGSVAMPNWFAFMAWAKSVALYDNAGKKLPANLATKHEIAWSAWKSSRRQAVTDCRITDAAAMPPASDGPVRPGYILGDHWLEVAYERICAGDREEKVMDDYGWVRLTREERDAIWMVAEAYAGNDGDPECERLARIMHGLWRRTK